MFQAVLPQRTRFFFLGAVLAAFTTSACTVHTHPTPHPHRAQAVKIDKTHRHTHRCGHYRHDGRWYHVSGHVHGRACGHVKVKGVWVIRR